MFNYDVDMFEEEGLLRPDQVSKIRSSLEDLIERLYEPCIVDEEVDFQIRKIANELGVYVPKRDSKFEKYGFEYIEDILNSNIRKMDVAFYSVYSDKFWFLHELSKSLDVINSFGITLKDLEMFCSSDIFSIRVADAKNYFQEISCALKNA